ncbi:hypothetical protein AMTRI_Chr09g32280 [Amborella trichopoda]
MDSYRLASNSTGIYAGNIFRRPHLDLRVLEVFLAVGVFVLFHQLRPRNRRGLASWPLLGMLPSLLFGLKNDIYEWISCVLIKEGGTFVFKGPLFSNLNCVITSDPRNIEHILKTKFVTFPKGEYFRKNLSDLLGSGIFNSDDDVWQRQRKVASIEFHSTRFRQLMHDSLERLVHERLLPVLELYGERISGIDLQDVLLRLTFDNVCMIAFGVDPGCLSHRLPEIPFANAFEKATEASVMRFLMPTSLWKIMRFFNLGSEKELREALVRVDEFAGGVIRERKRELLSDFGKKSDLLTVFMRMRDEEGRAFSEEFLRDICINFILAGRDTSSVALAWFFWLVGQNPGVEEKILEEMRGILGNREVEGPPKWRPEEVKKMEYLQAALSEALRLYPSVPVDHKEVREDDVLPDGTELKKGTKVIYAIYSMGRMESIWGEDCLKFKPQRWLRDGKFTSESAYKFTAFNGGPRLCLGKDFAYYQMKYVASSILYEYHVRVLEGHQVEPKLALTMYMKHGLRVTLQRRKNPGRPIQIKENVAPP